MGLGIEIKKARKKSKLTQKQLGELIGRSEVTIRKYEADDVTPSLEIIEEIANALEIQSYELLNYESSPYVRDTIEYKTNDLVEEKAFEVFQYYYNEMKLEESTKMNAIDFYNQDKYLSESLVKAIGAIAESNIAVYKKRIDNGANEVRNSSIFIT